MAREQGAETIDFNRGSGRGAARADRRDRRRSRDRRGRRRRGAAEPRAGRRKAEQKKAQFEEEREEVAPEARAGKGATGSRRRARRRRSTGRSSAREGRHALDHRRLPGDVRSFPIGMAMNEEPHPQDGQLPPPQVHPAAHRARAEPARSTRARILTKGEPIDDAIDAYKAFDKREAGWIKVELKPAA